ncbi:MAG: sulfatase-like hydrolase/transferase [Beijerinckiaceae bacterium]|jgi:hypothetical protein|nr:sulfatase-like hydrolase/transferase [Beijerinckiaceae bacterium]
MIPTSKNNAGRRHLLAAAVFFVCLAAGVALFEGGTAPHAGAATGLLVAASALVSGRALLSVGVTCALTVAIAAGAWIKRERSGFILHAWDLFDFEHWRFPVSEIAQQQPLALSALVFAAIFGLGALFWSLRFERVNVSRPFAALACLALLGLTALFASLKGEPRQTQYTWEDHNLSSFYSSWPEALEALRRGQLFESGQASNAETPLTRAVAAPTCAPPGRPPHILLVHQESVTPPMPLAALPGRNLAFDAKLAAFFTSHDGGVRRLRVEAYGGSSWLTEFSVLTGMASRFFGGMQNFVQVYMTGRVTDALPSVLARCGYRNVMFYPYLKNFFGASRFFESIGLREIFDLKAQGAPTAMEKDSFYFGNALEEIARHLEASRQPLFVFLQTMGAHWPYDVTFWPERKVAGGGPGTDPEMHEYLRRLAMSQADHAEFRAALASRFPGERFLIVQYGDHQPLATRRFFGFSDEEIEDMNRALPENSPAFETFYSVEGVNFIPGALPAYPLLDVAYLGAVVLTQAGLPLPESWRERLDLMAHCGGLYATCADRAAVLALHRRLVDMGAVRGR